jgi:hypothetical protein
MLNQNLLMNSIKAQTDKSELEGGYNFINICIDNQWLDEMLDKFYPEKMFKDLIPTLVSWMDNNDEKEVVWKRILPEINKVTICPILMCPDDNDFSCTLIVAEIKNVGDTIKWNKLGIDKTHEWEAEKVGTDVQWLDKIEPFEFETKDYLLMLENFKKQNG